MHDNRNDVFQERLVVLSGFSRNVLDGVEGWEAASPFREGSCYRVSQNDKILTNDGTAEPDEKAWFAVLTKDVCLTENETVVVSEGLAKIGTKGLALRTRETAKDRVFTREATEVPGQDKPMLQWVCKDARQPIGDMPVNYIVRFAKGGAYINPETETLTANEADLEVITVFLRDGAINVLLKCLCVLKQDEPKKKPQAKSPIRSSRSTITPTKADSENDSATRADIVRLERKIDGLASEVGELESEIRELKETNDRLSALLNELLERAVIPEETEQVTEGAEETEQVTAAA